MAGGSDAVARPAAGTAVLDAPESEAAEPMVNGFAGTGEIPQQKRWEDDEPGYQPGRVVREKQHGADPMTVDQALYEMELVGHDFYLFNDSEAGRPSVVYRRKGFDYGVIRLG
jgi:hypothetical protein